MSVMARAKAVSIKLRNNRPPSPHPLQDHNADVNSSRVTPGLFQNALERTPADFPMHRHDAATIAATQDRVAAVLPFKNKSQPFQCAARFPSRNIREFRHAPGMRLQMW